MIPVRQTQLSTPYSRYPSTTNKMMFGIPVVLLGLLLPLGLVGNAALGSCVCDEQILGKEHCDQFLATCRKYRDDLDVWYQRADSSGLKICNESSETVYAAYASAYEGYGYIRKGWYTINPGSCPKVITESMRDKNYYIRIEQSDGNKITREDNKIAREELSFCMWLPQSDGVIYKASYNKCRKEWKVDSSKSFEKMEKGHGFIVTVR